MSRFGAQSLFLAVVLAAAGCDRPAAEPAATASPPSATGATGAANAVTASVPEAPHGGGGAVEKALSAEGAIVTTASFQFELPAEWRREQPSSGMRLAQAVLPGDAGPGELAVFHFGAGQGGTVESNFERWLGQVEAPAGGQPKPTERGELAAPGFKTTWIDARGTLLPSTMGSGPSTPQPGFRLLGAVVEGEGGPWFFKVTGPEKTLGDEREAFFTLLRGVRRP
jgi:hypothetical protein